MNKIILRKAIKDEWVIISNFEKNAISKIFYPTVTKEEEIKKFLDENELFFIIFRDQKIGIIAYQERKDSFYICEFIIGLKFQGKGFGKQALEALIKKAGNNKPATLVTHPENSSAISIYLKAEFKIKGWKDNYFNDGTPRLLLVKE
ncbi:hypothetical protein COX95_02375 [bacterium CG_4_10_14_0_2_um_filter_33_32]|nr:MAG: hypothetical protein AUJ93_02960 [bacterium CG2_30_33_46]PIR67887.1 MAG: hypothetical protein COU50_00950 [bacterium CG10_big_fil_rev_8_21_14_0_10_33_18]PIU76736.1 MAG: hypothetical protein COS74_02510 [bacterium CG06_land_8_20_14_3_00_33_50]PIW81326.1 MAG: hypothetical protein COZ97_02390 [bacterium CG_4_8_14_3_um_filter_33_28]PIY85200.1 MAG: hypothetical protein COY76_03425 [bacterium CG_4_10_14_0_8_um_filter_33_57]PIZ86055.1 MAG: hypothetical protein COX95_02375 [bacterium CG_4_10_1